MKRIILISALGLAGVLALPAQQGRGGPPLAWNDQDKDGICDVTGENVGQNRGQGRRMGPGRAWAGGRGRGLTMAGRGRGMGPCGRGRGRQGSETPAAAKDPKPPTPAEEDSK